MSSICFPNSTFLHLGIGNKKLLMATMERMLAICRTKSGEGGEIEERGKGDFEGRRDGDLKGSGLWGSRRREK